MTAASLPALLDYSKPPPGFILKPVTSSGRFDPINTKPRPWGVYWLSLEEEDGHAKYGEHHETEAKATAAAWRFYRTHNDPPRRAPDTGIVRASSEGADITGGLLRSLAWGWYDLRHDIVVNIGAQVGLDREAMEEGMEKILPWTDDECAEVQAFLAAPCPPDVNPFREGPACLMRTIWGPKWQPPVKPVDTAVQLDLIAPPVPMPLDYSQPPPGYAVGPDPGSDAEGRWFWMCEPRNGYGHRGDVDASEPLVIAAAWADFKAHDDPPGFKGSNAEWIEGEGWRPFTAADFVKQRAEAWAFYDRRRTLALRCARAQRPHEHWPRALSWTTEDCDQIVQWLAHGGPAPAALG